MLTYNTETAVLFIIFNRPNTTQQVFEQIKKVKPKRLYVAADGARNENEHRECEEARTILTYIDWDCQLFKLYQEKNLGCDTHCYQAISWFFEQEPEGIVLEDDCVPSLSFFGFCSTLLEKYRDDERIGHITGSNFQFGKKRGDGSYYFSNLTHVGGWSGWRRAWQSQRLNDNNRYELFKRLDYLSYLPSHAPFYAYWNKHFEQANCRANISWDFRYAYNNLINNRLSIIPSNNLIWNIGYYEKATHYIKAHPFANLKSEEIENIVHPRFILPDIEADLYSQVKEYNYSWTALNQQSETIYLKDRINAIFKSCHVQPKIPKIIHQIYEDLSGPSSVLKEISQSWKEMNPDWEYRFWDKNSINTFLTTYYPEFMTIYDSFPYDVQRWDAIRYLILYKIGGLYVDMDYECTENITPILCDMECGMGLEPKENAVRRRMPYIVGNAFMATIPNHPYFKEIISSVFCNTYNQTKDFSKTSILDTTGPYMTTRVYTNSKYRERVCLIPAELVAPLTRDEVMKIVDGQMSEHIKNKIEKSYAIHYFFGSWYEQITR